MDTTDSDTTVPLRGVHTYVLRAGRMTEAQKRDYEIHCARWCLPFQESIINFADVFENTNPVTIEIGFGMGKATAIIAAENPDKNYLGIEVHRAGVGRLLGEIEKRGLSNVRIVEYDAIEVLRHMIPNGSVAAFHIFFPDPWPKKRHHKRRMVQRPRTDLIASKLEQNGYIYFVTDWEPYAEEAYIELTQTPTLVSPYEGYAPRQTWRPETRFEEKGLKAAHPIHEIIFRALPEDVADGQS